MALIIDREDRGARASADACIGYDSAPPFRRIYSSTPAFLRSDAPDMGRTEMLNAFAAIILGGFGNVNGTILGALLIGMIQSLGAVYISNAYSTSISFGLLVLTLVFFPRGLVPERVDENV